MKILLITTRFSPYIGGVEKVVESLAEDLAERHEVCVLTSMESPGFKNALNIQKPVIQWGKYQVKRIWINLPRKFFGFLGLPVRLPLSVLSLVNFTRKYNPDIINVHFLDDLSLYIWLAGLFVKKPLIVNIHGNDLHIFSKKPLYRFFIGKVLKRAHKVVVNSEYMKADFTKAYPEFNNKVEIIPNGMSIKEISVVKPRRYFRNPYIFYVGRIVNKKGVDILIRAFAKANLKNCNMLIEGKGEDLEMVKKLAEKLQISDKIKFTEGSLNKDQKFAYMKGAMFGVMPSRIEPFGIVALEFLASGTPLVASKTGGLRSILENEKTCLFYKNKSVDDLADKMKKMYKNEKLRKDIIRNGLKEVKKYDRYTVSKRYEDIYFATANIDSPEVIGC